MIIQKRNKDSNEIFKKFKNENYDKNVEINQLLYEKEDNNSIQTIGIPEKNPSIEMISETIQI